MSRFGYPPSHQDLSDPQPEVCDLCGLLVGGRHLRLQNIDGLRGWRICQYHPYRDKPTFRDIERMFPGVPGPKYVGQGRVYEPGSETWWETS